MTAPVQPEVDELLATLAALSARLAGREGNAIREHLQRLGQILTLQGPDGELRAHAAAELEQLIAAVARLGGLRGPSAKAVRGMDLGQLAGGLRSFVAYLRAPTTENQAQVEQLVANLKGSALVQPVPLDETQIGGRVEALAIESARRHGLTGAELRHAVERMKREMRMLVTQLEIRARDEGSRAQAANDLERLIDTVVQIGAPLGQALARERAPIMQAFRSVDLAHMALGMRAFAAWVGTPAEDGAAHVAELRARFAEILGPPTTGDPARSEAERRADFEREIQLAVDQIFRGTRPASP